MYHKDFGPYKHIKPGVYLKVDQTGIINFEEIYQSVLGKVNIVGGHIKKAKLHKYRIEAMENDLGHYLISQTSFIVCANAYPFPEGTKVKKKEDFDEGKSAGL